MTNSSLSYADALGFFYDKTVLVTGHSGFKGAWLTKILLDAGAKVVGYSLASPTKPSLFTILGFGKKDKTENLANVFADIRDYAKLSETFLKYKPEMVLHLAAQPIVRMSYKEPRLTYETNVMGTVNVCECVRSSLDSNHPVKSFLNVTTDKVYRNNEWNWGYRENEPLDGFDPYSNSKSCSELVTHSYINSFFKDKNGHWLAPTSTARAGNVIGGGDFASDRIIPDCVRSVQSGKPLVIRNPNSTRPYQHVLEPLFTYLTIVASQVQDASKAGFYNVGPDECDCVTTGDLVTLFGKYYGAGFESRIKRDPSAPHEANFLKLDASLVKATFGWKPTWHIEEAIEKTVEWTKAYLGGKDVHSTMTKQIEEFCN